MSKSGKTAEPSMEEILSSIRKIIAEEPIGAGALSASGRPGPALATEATLSKTAANGSASSAVSKANVDDILGMADRHPEPAMVSAADAPGHGGAAVPSWLFPTARADAVPDGGQGPASLKSGVMAPAAAEQAQVRDTPKPFFPSHPATQSATVAGGMNGMHANSAPGQKPAEPEQTDVQLNVDLGSVVPSRAADTTPVPQPSVLDRRTPQSGLPEWLSRASGAAVKVSPPQAIASPSEPTKIVAREPTTEAPALSELPRAAGGKGAATPLGNGAAGATPLASASATLETSRASKIDPSEAVAALEKAAATAPIPQSSSPQLADAVAAVAPSPASQSETPAEVSSAVVPVEAPATNAATADTANHAAVPKPTLLNDRSRSPKVAAPGDLMPTVLPSGAVRTLDDTIIELLRPMIRQWLDDNMPRMVEKALRVEMAASLKPKGDQPKH